MSAAFSFAAAPTPVTVGGAPGPRVPGAPGSDQPGQEYQPGACNIGTADIALRRRSGHLAVAASAGLLAALLAARAPRAARLLVAIPAASAASGYIQARSRFCAAYGSAGIYNFGALGSRQKVADAESRALDAARSRRIGQQSLAIGLGVAALTLALPGPRRG